MSEQDIRARDAQCIITGYVKRPDAIVDRRELLALLDAERAKVQREASIRDYAESDLTAKLATAERELQELRLQAIADTGQLQDALRERDEARAALAQIPCQSLRAAAHRSYGMKAPDCGNCPPCVERARKAKEEGK